MQQFTASLVHQIAIILVGGLFLKFLSEKTKAPFTVLLMLFGTLLAFLSIVDMSTAPGLNIVGSLVRMLALIIVVYANSFYSDVSTFFKRGPLIVSLSTLGVIFTASIIALILHYFLNLPVLVALFLGSLLCGTDPAVIASMMDRFPERLKAILNAESIANQPLTIILPLMIMDYMLSKQSIFITLTFYFAKFFALIIFGVLTGVFMFFIGRWLLKHTDEELEDIAGLSIAMLSYSIAELLGGSGILAVGIAGILLGSSKTPRKEALAEFNRSLALLFTIFVFVFLGAEVKTIPLEITRSDILLVIFFIVLARLITVLVISYKSSLNFKERITLGLIAPRGMGPAALAPLALFIAEQSDMLSSYAAFLVVKIVYLTIIVSAIIAMLAASFSSEEALKKPKKGVVIKV